MAQMIAFTRGKVYLVPSFILRLCRLVVVRCVMMGTWRVGETCFAPLVLGRGRKKGLSLPFKDMPHHPISFHVASPTEEANPQ